MTAASGLRIELQRKGVHVGCGLIAFALAWLAWPQALGLALGAVAFNLLVTPRLLASHVYRDADHARGYAIGALLYATSVVLLVLLWRDALALVAIGWAVMAFGDGAASVVGMLWGKRRVPWNPRKSWEGTLAFAACGAAGAAAAGAFVASQRPGSAGPVLASAGAVALAGAVAACATALLETVESGVDDNLLVPLAGSAIAWAALRAGELAGPDVGAPVAEWAVVASVGLGLAAGLRRSLTWPGAIAAALVGAACASVGWGGFLALLAFYALGTGATRAGRATKEARGIAQERGGRRGFGNVVANGGMAALAAMATWTIAADGPYRHLAHVGLVAACATAAFDTVSSEIGKAFGRTTVLITSLRRVPPGTEGAVSLEGTAAGLLASVLVALVGLASGLFALAPGWGVAAVVLGAFAGSTFESVVGSACTRRGHAIQNDVLNFANTAAGAGVAVALAWAAGGRTW